MTIKGDTVEIPIVAKDGVSKPSEKMSKSASALRQRFKSLGFSTIALNQALDLAGRAIRATDRAISATVGQFASFEDALVGVGKTTNISGKALETLGQEFQRLSETMPATTLEIAEVAKTAGQLGVQGSADILKFSETMIKLASASDLAGESGATALARILNTTDGGVQNIDRFASSIVALVNSFAATEGEIAFMAQEVARSTAVFDLTSAQVAGLSTAMKAVGIQAQLGGSAVGRTMREMDSALRNGGDSLKALSEITGKTSDVLKKEFADNATGVFKTFIEGLGKIDKAGGSSTEVLARMGLEGEHILKVLPALAKRSELVGKALKTANVAYRENTALNEEAGKAFKTLSSEYIKFINLIKNTVVNISANLAPALKDLLITMREGLTTAIKNLVAGWKSLKIAFDSIDFNKLAEDGKTFGKSLLIISSPAIVAAAIALAPPLMAIASAFITMVAPAAIIAIKFLAIGAAMIAIAGAIDFISINFENLKTILGAAFVKIFLNIRIAFDNMILSILTGLSKLVAQLGKIPGMSGVAVTAMKGINEVTSQMVDQIIDLNSESEQFGGLIESTKNDLKGGFLADVWKTAKEFLDKYNVSLDDQLKLQKQINSFNPNKPKKGEDNTGGSDTNKLSVPKVELFSADQLTVIKNTFGELTHGITSAASSMTSAALGYAAVANMIVDAFQMLVDFIPNLVNKVGDLIKSIVNFPQTLVNSFGYLQDMIVSLIADFVPNIFEGLTTAVKDTLKFAFKELPKALISLFTAIPNLFSDLFEDLTVIIGEAAKDFGSNLVTLVPKMIAGFIKGLPRFFKSLINFIPNVAIALVDGLILGLKMAANDLAAMFGFDDIFNIPDIEQQMEAIKDGISRSTEQLFKVVDLEAGQRGADMADRIRNAILSATKTSVGWLEKAWIGIKEAFRWIDMNILQPIKNLVVNAFQWVIDNILSPIGNIVSTAFGWVVDNILAPLGTFVSDAFQFVMDIFDSLFDIVDKAFKAVFDFFTIDNLKSIVTGAFDWIKDLFDIKAPAWLTSFSDAIKKLLDWSPADLFNLGGIAGGAKSVTKNIAKSYKSSALGKVTTSIGSALKFADGGVIPSYLATGGKVPMGDYRNGHLYAAGGSLARGTDTVKAMLTPGEFVINRDSAKNNMGLLSFINQSKGTVTPSQSNTNISIVINTKTFLDKDQIRREIVPEIERELKKKSLSGSFVLSGRGIR